MRNSKNFRLHQTIEAVVPDPTVTPPRPTLWSRLTGWEQLFCYDEIPTPCSARPCTSPSQPKHFYALEGTAQPSSARMWA